MPNNITHLPTDETLESGLSLIAQALDGDKIAQISAKLSSQSKSLSEIDSFLAENLAGINTKLVSKGSTAASLYSDIPGKIETIEAASTPFRLLKNVTTPTVVTNGSFTVSYEGEPPADLMNNRVGGVLLPDNKAGINLKDINYTISSIDTVNKTITFSLNGQTDGVLTEPVAGFVAILSQDSEALSTALCVMVGLPVNYEPRIVSINDVVVTDRTDITEAEIHIVPTGVSPKADLNTVNAIGIVFSNGELYSELELEVSQQLPQYPEDYLLLIAPDAFDSTVENGYMFVSTEPNSGTGGQTFKVGLTFKDKDDEN